MPRMRTLKPGFFSNDQLAELPPLARLLFQGLWCLADREGRLEDRPKRIKAEILPYDNCNVDRLLQALAERGFILRYVSGEHQFIQVVNFSKHQNPHQKEPESTIPAPDEHSASTVPGPGQSDANPVPDQGEHSASMVLSPEEPCSNFNSPNHGIPVQEQEQSLEQVQEQGDTARTNGAPPRGNPRVQAVKDAFRRVGYEPAMQPRDYAAIKGSTAEPDLIAEVYMAVANRQWGDDWQRRRLNVYEAINWVNAYVEERAEQEVRNGAA